MVEAVASNRADQPLNMTVLPWRTGCDGPVSNAHGSHATYGRGAVDGVAVTEQVARCLIPRERLSDLLGDPLGRRMCRDVGPDEPSPLQAQDHHAVEKLELDGRNDEQIDRGDVSGVIAQEGERWLGLSEQRFGLDKWHLCRVQ